jgi:hypothetical protein
VDGYESDPHLELGIALLVFVVYQNRIKTRSVEMVDVAN